MRTDIVDALSRLSEEEFEATIHKALQQWVTWNCHKLRAIYLRGILWRWLGSFHATLSTIRSAVIVGDSELSERLGKMEPSYRGEGQPWREEEQS